MLKWLLLLFLAFFGAGASAAPVTVTQTSWHGWRQAVKLSNGVVEAVIVPQIGRVMAFEFTGHPETNPLYENPEWMADKKRVPKPGEWANYGGDKVWPAPQSDWPRYLGHDWPPDPAFDGLPETVHLLPNGLRLSSPASNEFGLHIERTLTLHSGEPCLYLTQTLVRTAPGPAPDRPLAVWTIAQTRGDALYLLPLPVDGTFKSLVQPPAEPPFSQVTTIEGRRVLLVRRDPGDSHKIGTAGREGWLVRVSPGGTVFTERTVPAGGAYPDGNCPSELYTAGGKDGYVEMETLGPLVPVRPDHPLALQIIWQLTRLPPTARNDSEAAAAALRTLKH